MADYFHVIKRKARSLWGYKRLFSNWWIAALARYCGGLMGAERQLHLRDGRCFTMRPASDYIALGEVFSVETYGACRDDKGVRLVWDIGSNIGLFVIWASEFFPNARFESFEPCASTLDVLKRNQAGNPRLQWHIHPYGLSSRNEVCEGHVPRGMYGSVSRYGGDGETVPLPMKKVGEVWQEMGSPVIDLMKMDCEGGEYEIVEAMPEAMLKNVRTILMEVHPVNGKDTTDLAKRLASSGFSLNHPPSFTSLLVARRP